MEGLATEILHELKLSAKRWFIAFVIMVIVELITIAGFLWYISLPTDEITTQYEQSVDNVQDSDNMKQLIVKDGDIDGESKTDSQ